MKSQKRIQASARTRAPSTALTLGTCNFRFVMILCKVPEFRDPRGSTGTQLQNVGCITGKPGKLCDRAHTLANDILHVTVNTKSGGCRVHTSTETQPGHGHTSSSDRRNTPLATRTKTTNKHQQRIRSCWCLSKTGLISGTRQAYGLFKLTTAGEVHSSHCHGNTHATPLTNKHHPNVRTNP